MMNSKEYQNAKCDYDGPPDDADFFSVAIPKLHKGYQVPALGIIDGEMRIKRDELQALFDIQITGMFEVIDKQLQRMQQRYPQEQVAHLILSGGLGNSAYVQARLRSRYTFGASLFPNIAGLQVRVAPDPQLAVCKGIVADRLQKLEAGQSILRWRCCRASYGLIYSDLYDHTNPNHFRKNTFSNPANNKIDVSNVMNWFIKQGEPVSVDYPIVLPFWRRISCENPQRVFSITVFISHLDKDMLPYTLDQNCSVLCSVQSDFSNVELSRFKLKNRHFWNFAEKYYEVNYFIKVALGSADIRFEPCFNDQKLSKDQDEGLSGLRTHDTRLLNLSANTAKEQSMEKAKELIAAISSEDLEKAKRIIETGMNVNAISETRGYQKAVGCIRTEWEVPAVLNFTRTSPPGHDPRSEFAQSSLSHHVVLIGVDITGDGDGDGDPLDLAIEATTCGEYVHRTWGELGSQLLADIDDGLKGKTAPKNGYQCTHLETLVCDQAKIPANITVQTSAGHLEAISNALTWICRAIRSPPSSDSQRPFILSSSTCRLTVNKEDTEAARPLSLEFILHDSPLPVTKYQCWLKLLRSGVVTISNENVVVKHDGKAGLLRLPGKGLRVAFDLLVQIAEVEYAIRVNNTIVLVGYQTALIPQKIGKRYVQFHLETKDEGQINPYTLSFFLESSSHSVMSAEDVASLREKCCFVGWCLQVATAAPIQTGLSVQASYIFASNSLTFPPSSFFSQMLNTSSKELAIVYDAGTKRAWMMPKLSLLLHMCHAWVGQMLEGREDPIPFVEPYNDAKVVVNELENSGGIVVCGANGDAFSLRNLLLGLNINLLETNKITNANRASSKYWYGFEFNDVVCAPGKGSCLKETKIERTVSNWLEMTKYVDALIVCDGIGVVIKPVQGRECKNCGSLRKNQDYLAVPLSCMERLMWRNDKVLPEVLVHDSQVEISSNTSWIISTKSFHLCSHPPGGTTQGDRGWGSPDLFQHITSSRTQINLNALKTFHHVINGQSLRTILKKRESLKVSMAGAIVFG